MINYIMVEITGQEIVLICTFPEHLRNLQQQESTRIHTVQRAEGEEADATVSVVRLFEGSETDDLLPVSTPPPPYKDIYNC